VPEDHSPYFPKAGVSPPTNPVPPSQMPSIPKTPLGIVWRYVSRGGGWRMPAVVALTVVGAVVDSLQPYALGELVGALTGERNHAFAWFLALCAIWAGGPLLARLHLFTTTTTFMMLRMRIHDDLFAYLQGHAPRYFLDNMAGALATRVRTAASATTTLVDMLFSTLPRLGIMFVVAALLVAAQAAHLLPLFAVYVAVFVGVAYVLAQRSRPYAKATSTTTSAYTGRMVDSLTNWDVVRAFARSAHEGLTLAPYSRREYEAAVELRFVLLGMRLALHAVSAAFLIALVWWAFQGTMAGEMSVGTFTMLVSLCLLISGNVNTLGDNLLVFVEQMALLSESLEAIVKPHEIVDPPGAPPLIVKGGAIDIENITFRFADGTTVFENLNLSVRAGERVGLVGPSGAGKSTLLKLLRRQFLLQQGRILIDGQDIAAVNWDSLHEAFAEVPQVPGVFHRSVRENILYGRPDATEDQIIAAARLAHCHDFISLRPGGYNAVVGEKGMKLSGGERQRVAVARAFIKNAPILLLDEATSSLDSEVEHLIQDALLKLMQGRTVIAIAHRLSTIMHLDRIIVMEAGRIVEEGTHAALLARNGAYARLWNRQAGGFI